MVGLFSLLPIFYGVAFAVYAFTVGSVTKILISDAGEAVVEETIVEDSGAGGAILAFAPLALAVFVAILLHLARKDSDQAALNMAWVFSGFVAIAGALGASGVGAFFIVPGVLLLLVTAATQYVVRASRT